MAYHKISQDYAKQFLDDLFAGLGSPEDITQRVDEILFDWLLNHEQQIGDWHKERLFTLKSLRDAFHSLSGKAEII